MRARGDAEPTTVVLVHGAWHSGWSWGDVPRLLTDRGARVAVVDLPGIGRSSGGHDLSGHTDYLRDHVASLTGPVAVVSHSYGGAVVTNALDGLPSLSALVYLAAFQLEPGESCRDANPGTADDDPATSPTLDGDYLVVGPEAARHLFYGDCIPAQAAAAAAHLTPEHVGTVTTPVTAAAWHRVPSTYVVTARDVALPPAAQRAMAARADRVEVLDTAHAPMLTHPTVVADLLVDVLGLGHARA